MASRNSALQGPLQKLNPLYRLLILFILLSIFAKVSGFLQTWQQVALWSMSLMFFFAGVGHFTKLRFQYVKMVPPSLPQPMMLIYLSGLAEILFAVTLQIAELQQLAAVSAILFLIAVFPANYYAAKADVKFAGGKHTPVGERAVLQIVFMIALYWGAFSS